MPILKNRTQGNFTIVAQSITRDESLSLVERGLLLTILSFPDGWSLSTAGLVMILPDGRDKISKAMSRLVSKGYLVKKQSKVGGRFDKNIVEVFDSPQIIPEGMGETGPITEPPSTDKPVTEKPQQLNNYKSKIKNKKKTGAKRQSKVNPFNQYEQNTYDYDELEKNLIRN